MPDRKKLKPGQMRMTIRDQQGNEVDLLVKLVNSTNVSWVGYPETGEPMMVVQYKHGGRYAYLGVSRQKTVATMRAKDATAMKSVGTYIARRIKPHHEAVKLT